MPEEIEAAFRERPNDSNKYSVGVVAIVGGSAQYVNAPVIAGLGARAGGAGLVRLVVPRTTMLCSGSLLPEATYATLRADCKIRKTDAVVIGMGLGTGKSAERLVKRMLTSGAAGCGRLVVDADALTLLARLRGTKKAFKFASGVEAVLTPHEGEAARLLGSKREDVAADRQGAAEEIAALYGATVVLKGPGTIVVSGDGRRRYTNESGNPFMALGGMGDLLAGLIGARWAYLKDDAFLAASGAVWLHGAASDDLIDCRKAPTLANTAERIGSMLAERESPQWNMPF